MKRTELAHILRAACEIAGDPHILVIGSQSILGSFSEDQLPSDATHDPEALPSEALCLDPHDLVVSKLVAGREKDYVFARALLEVGLVRDDVLRVRAELLPVIPAIKRRVMDWLDRPVN